MKKVRNLIIKGNIIEEFPKSGISFDGIENIIIEGCIIGKPKKSIKTKKSSTTKRRLKVK